MKQSLNLKFVFKTFVFFFAFFIPQECSALVFKVTAEKGTAGYKNSEGHFGSEPAITHFPKGKVLVVSEREDWEDGTYVLVKDSKSSREVWVNRNQVAPKPYANSHALLIGAWDYPGTDDDLQFVKQDIERLKIKLKKIGFEEKKIKILLKTQDTSERKITTALHWLINNTNPEDRILIAYAGHGQTVNGLGYIVPTNISPQKENYPDFISMADIQAIYKIIPAKHLFIVFDSCFSGALFEDSKGDNTFSFNDFRSVSNYLKVNTFRKARQALTAGPADQTVPADGPFMLSFVDAISTLAADGDQNKIITGSEVMNWVKSNSGKTLSPDSGELAGHQRGDFIFFDARNSKIKVKEAPQEPILKRKNLEPIKKVKSREFIPTPPGMVRILAGSFTMGADPVVGLKECEKYYHRKCKRSWYEDEGPPHEVVLDEFFIDKYEVTQEDFKEKMGTNLSEFKGKKLPVDSVTWEEASMYCKMVGKRLPTEAEWEKAAKGGKNFSYFWGDSFESGYSNFCDINCEDVKKSKEFDDGYKNTAPIKQFKPNGYGLFDTAGNVFEWVADWYSKGTYKSKNTENPKGPLNGKEKVVRGGSWSYSPRYLRTTDRFKHPPLDRNSQIGFRCAK